MLHFCVSAGQFGHRPSSVPSPGQGGGQQRVRLQPRRPQRDPGDQARPAQGDVGSKTLPSLEIATAALLLAGPFALRVHRESNLGALLFTKIILLAFLYLKENRLRLEWSSPVWLLKGLRNPKSVTVLDNFACGSRPQL